MELVFSNMADRRDCWRNMASSVCDTDPAFLKRQKLGLELCPFKVRRSGSPYLCGLGEISTPRGL